jgi:hypothetical protein
VRTIPNQYSLKEQDDKMLSKSHEQYLARFRGEPEDMPRSDSDVGSAAATKDGYESKSRLAKAYEVALDIRKFEIELYWKRSNSFWLIIAALGALLIGAVSAKDVDVNVKSVVTFAICSFASVVAYAWSLVNRAGKFWQRNWECQVDLLEDAVLGPLYKTVFSKRSPAHEQLYSVSKLNLALSHCVIAVFLLGAAVSTPLSHPEIVGASSYMWVKLLFAVFAGIAVIYISLSGKAESSKSGVNDLRLHYTSRKVDSLSEYLADN